MTTDKSDAEQAQVQTAAVVEAASELISKNFPTGDLAALLMQFARTWGVIANCAAHDADAELLAKFHEGIELLLLCAEAYPPEQWAAWERAGLITTTTEELRLVVAFLDDVIAVREAREAAQRTTPEGPQHCAPRACIICGCSFTPRSTKQRYCSADCIKKRTAAKGRTDRATLQAMRELQLIGGNK